MLEAVSVFPYLFEGVSSESACTLKDYLIFRVDERERTEELAGESHLEGEAINFAGLVVETEPGDLDGISYEVRVRATGERIHTARSGRREVALA